MYSPHEKGLRCWYWSMLLSVLVVAIVVIGVIRPFAHGVTSLVMALLGGLVIACIWHTNYRLKCYLKARYSDIDVDLSRDRITRLAGKDALMAQLQTECRRAIREYSPLSLVGVTLNLDAPSERDLKLVSMVLKQLLHRPGDLVYRLDGSTFILLLPSTNERVLEFCERCLNELDKANITVKAKLSVCSFQPSAELNERHVITKLQELIDDNRRQTDQSIMSSIEQPMDPSILYD